ncbi:PucR family transcriptional regulator [Pseudonocardia oroxyli]|uniref:PucR C-terminal helix-turn-helix domain-containing protein n=1 Tax=Pseudonocardia oroxyli TaxID=366584 RepID=A0A1G8DX96_PSEOR|nr:helix-turn-helix domain-containing protein [Pseudonocardia oroxyli]SDH62284.1 PucR C-terminal helix-turn-helix domain-containing protein [Pseudonocardia oroxyli]
MSPLDPQSLIDDLAKTLRRSVVVADSEIRLMWASPHYGDEDGARVSAILQRRASPDGVRHILSHGLVEWKFPGVVEASPALSMNRRLVYPLRHDGRLLAVLFVIDADDSLTADEDELIRSVGARLQEPVRQLLAEPDDGDTRLHGTICRLVDPDPDTRSAAAVEARALGMSERSAVTAFAVIDSLGQEVKDGREQALLVGVLRCMSLRWAVVVDQRVLAIDGGDRATRLARARAGVAGTAGGGCRVVAGCGGRADLHDQVGSYEQADRALRGAAMIPQMGEALGEWELGAYRVLLQLPDSALRRKALPDEIRRLLDDPRADQLFDSLEAYLDCGGSGTEAARLLHVHRTSLYYRLQRIEQLTGSDLADGMCRLHLHLGVKQARLAMAAERRADTEVTHTPNRLRHT